MPPCLTTFFYSPAASLIFAGEFFVFIGTCAIIKSKMNSDEFYEFEDRAYLNPTLSSGEQEAFINNLRNTQNQNNAQIAEQTYNLGTEVPSNLGGLGGGESYFTSRYQTPQVGEMTETLKAAAQAQALNDVMNDYNAQLQNRYKQAYRSAQSRARRRAGGVGGTGGTGGTGGNSSSWDGDFEDDPTDKNDGYDHSGETPGNVGSSQGVPKLQGHNLVDAWDGIPGRGGRRVTYDYTDNLKYYNGDFNKPYPMENYWKKHWDALTPRQ